MKNLNIFTITGLAFLLFLSACKKDDEDSNPDPDTQNENGTMTAKIDGNDFVADVDATARNTMGVVLISGQNSNGQIQLSFYNPDEETGEFLITQNNSNTGIYLLSTDINENYYSYTDDYTGTIEISEFTDTNIKGTFEFTAGNLNGDEVTISDGEFDVGIVATELG